MKKNKNLLMVLLTLLMLSVSSYASEGYKNLFITITTDNLKQAGMASAIAGAMQGAGVNTTVFIGAEAAELVLRKGGQEAFGATGKSIREMLIGFMKKGGKVMLCGMCAKYQELTKKDIIYGVKIVGPGDVAGALLAPSTQTISF